MSEKFGRYLDVDGDGIPYRTYPGTHPTKGSFFTRGTSRDEYAVYTENVVEYVKNMERLLHKWETAKACVPAPDIITSKGGSKVGVIHFGTSMDATLEAVDYLDGEGLSIDSCRIRAFPFNQAVEDFIEQHETVFVVEQNRDAQMRSLLVNDCDIDPKHLIKVLSYDGMPITARFIEQKITEYISGAKVTPLRRKDAKINAKKQKGELK